MIKILTAVLISLMLSVNVCKADDNIPSWLYDDYQTVTDFQLRRSLDFCYDYCLSHLFFTQDPTVMVIKIALLYKEASTRVKTFTKSDLKSDNIKFWIKASYTSGIISLPSRLEYEVKKCKEDKKHNWLECHYYNKADYTKMEQQIKDLYPLREEVYEEVERNKKEWWGE